MAEPITLERAKQRLAITSAHRDAEIRDTLIPAARWHVEDYTGLVLTRRQVVEVLDEFGPIITLRSWPIVSVDSVTYLDINEEPQAVADPRVRLGQRPARVFPPLNLQWPQTANPGEIAITVTAGYDEGLAPDHPEAVPPPLITAMLLLIGHWLESRETVVIGTIATDLPHGWMALARPFRKLL